MKSKYTNTSTLVAGFLSALIFLGAQLHARAVDVPPDDKLKSMVLESLLAFNKCIKAKDFTTLQEYEAAVFRDQIGPDKLLATFKDFIDQQIDISGIKDVQPLFTEAPAINSDGVLILTGSYPTTPTPVTFTLKYYNENDVWKIVGINVKLPGAPANQPVPADDKLKAMALESLLAFNQAVKDKDFTAFQKAGSAPFRGQFTPAKLLESFQPFIDQAVDISPIKDVQPAFDTPPAVNSDGVLILKGSYPTDPKPVSFTLKYIFDDNAWKIVGIDVDVK